MYRPNYSTAATVASILLFCYFGLCEEVHQFKIARSVPHAEIIHANDTVKRSAVSACPAMYKLVCVWRLISLYFSFQCTLLAGWRAVEATAVLAAAGSCKAAILSVAIHSHAYIYTVNHTFGSPWKGIIRSVFLLRHRFSSNNVPRFNFSPKLWRYPWRCCDWPPTQRYRDCAAPRATLHLVSRKRREGHSNCCCWFCAAFFCFRISSVFVARICAPKAFDRVSRPLVMVAVFVCELAEIRFLVW